MGTSSFACCKSNHTIAKQCRRPICLFILDRLIKERSRSLFISKRYAEARFTLCFRNYWCRGLIDEDSQTSWSTLRDFKSALQWSAPQDLVWNDRDGFPFLAFAASSDCPLVVQQALAQAEKVSDIKKRRSRIQGRVPKCGIVELGVSGKATALMLAMGASRSEIVSLLLTYGSDPYGTDISGMDPLMVASMFGCIHNVKFWLDKFPNWNLERKNKVTGMNGTLVSFFHLFISLYFPTTQLANSLVTPPTVLHCAVYGGPNRLGLVKLLLKHKPSLNVLFTNSGCLPLHYACLSEDADSQVLALLLERQFKDKNLINCVVVGKTFLWRTLFGVSRFTIKWNLSDSAMIKSFSFDSGASPILYAVRRGDVDAVNFLLQNGADPSLTNGFGNSPVDYCVDFPELRRALYRVIQQKRTTNKATKLYRRESTATDMKFPMYLVPLEQLHRLYGGKNPRQDRIEAHQDLKRRRELVRWEDLPIGSHIIFLSHEWVGWSHPDPHGIQLKTFLKVMKRLKSGEISQVEMNVFHTMMYKTNRIMKADEWKEMLSTAYVWIDWASMPQPSACPPSVPKDEKKKMGTDLGNAVKSIPAYVIFSSPHTHTQHTSYTKTREQVRRKSRFRCDRGSGMPSRRSKRSRHKTSNQDMLSNVQKSRMVYPGNDVFDA